VTPSHIAFFIAMYYYSGIVRVPSKDDYWRQQNDFWPVHPVAQNLTRDMYQYIWRNFHAERRNHVPPEEEVDEAINEEEDGTEDVNEDEEDDTEEEDEDEEDEEVEHDTRWYAKVSTFYDHVVRVSKKICTRPGSKLSLDEMMKLFKGRSRQTHRMKKKPIKEGFKFFSICDVETGFVYDFMPDGRMEKSSTYDYVIMLAGCLPQLDQYNYVIGMDNYFTWPRVMETLTAMGLGVVGTARHSRGWPPKEYKEVKDDRFNTVYIMNDKRKYKMIRWVDNNVVNMVSNVHVGNEVVERNRRRPRQTNTNRTHLQAVCGPDPVKRIKIPKVIDDYNHWMNGVDKADQLIAYYRTKLRCRRVWMPMFFHGLDIIRVNSYAACKGLGWEPVKQKDAHKEFTVGLIQALVAKGKTYEMRQTRNRLLGARSANGSPPNKRSRTSTKNPSLPDHRLLGSPHDHVAVDAPGQRNCRYCSYLLAKAKQQGILPLPKIARPARMCIACRDNLCRAHFNVYHGWR